MYQSGPGYYRVASKPAAEARMWMIAGIAGGIQPWWHHVGAYHEDRRMYHTRRAGDALVEGERAVSGRSHAGRERRRRVVAAQHRFLRPRRPPPTSSTRRTPASCTRWSARAFPTCRSTSTTSTGRGRPEGADPAERRRRCRTQQAPRSARFVQRGGSLFATGATSLYNEWGDPRPDFALADLFGCHRPAATPRPGGVRGGRGCRRRVCAEPERPHLPAAHCPNCARVSTGRTCGDEPAVDGHASRGPARVRRDGHPAVRRHA